MAGTRVSSRGKAKDVAETPETKTSTDSDTVTPEVTPTPEATSDAPAAPATESTESAEKPAEAPIDLEPFQKAIQESAASADGATGFVQPEKLTAPRSAYSALTAKGKKAAKAWIAEQMKDLLNKAVDDPSMITQARAYMLIQNGLVATTKAGPSAPVTPADKTADHVARIVALNLAHSFVDVPEGVAEDWEAKADAKTAELAGQVKAYKEWAEAEVAEGAARPDEPQVDQVVVRAYKLAMGRAAGKRAAAAPANDGTARAAYTGSRRSVSAHIESAFADKAVGDFLTISAIANHTSTEYGDDHPSSGAVSAALFGADGASKEKGGAKGAMNDGRRGAVKVAKATEAKAAA